MTRWHATKVHLNSANKQKWDIFLSKDVSKEGAKHFAVFQSFKDMIACAKTTENVYEVIPNDNSQVYMYFDLDRPKDPAFTLTDNEMVDAFLENLGIFLNKVYNISIQFVIGENCQVSIASTPIKFSAHIKCNILVPSVKLHKELIDNFAGFISNNTVVSGDAKTFMQYETIRCVNGQEKPIVKYIFDTGVYTNFRSYRMLYASKLGKENALQPFGNSSTKLEDHLVVVYKENPQKHTHTITTRSYAPNMKLAISKINDVVVQAQRVKSDDHEVINVPIAKLQQIQHYISNSKQIKDVIGNFKIGQGQLKSKNTYHFYIENPKTCQCAYAQRCHKSNRQFFEYKYGTNIVSYKCYDTDCITTWRNDGVWTFTLTPLKSYYLPFLSIKSEKSLHCKRDVIEWNESYNGTAMRPYPKVPICCVKANMGVGKTIEIINFIKNQVRDDSKCLFITFSRTLSRKYINSLREIGFVNYIDVEETTINQNRTIVCLDSIWRINNETPFDYIFIDETLSVLNHFNSNIMDKRSMVSMIFEMTLLSAKHIYLMDACVDNTLVFNFVEYLSHKKNVSPYWIKNDYIRPTNRKADIVTIHKNDSIEKELAQKIAKLWAQGKRSAVASSTKSFTDALNFELYLIFKEETNQPKILIYNSATDQETINKHAEMVNDVWDKYDILIYSPSISAGMSFERPHYHNFFAMLENSFFTPTVDIDLQMLFRVRQLIDGKMTIYIKNNVSADYFPSQEDTVDRWLDNDIRRVCQYFPNKPFSYVNDVPTLIRYDRKGAPVLTFDKDRMSYVILQGIVLNKGKSYKHFKDIVIDTLKTEYGIECNVFNDNSPHDDDQEKAQDETGVPDDWEELVINATQYKSLQSKARKGISLTHQEKLQTLIHKFFVVRMGIYEGAINKRLLSQFVGLFSDKKHKVDLEFQRLYKIKRFQRLLLHTLTENQNDFMKQMASLTNYDHNKDGTLDIYTTNKKKNFVLLIEGQSFINHILDPHLLIENKNIVISAATMRDAVKTYLNTVGDQQYKHLLKSAKIDTRYYGSKTDALEKCRKFASIMLDAVFGIDATFTRKSHKADADDGEFQLKCKWLDLIDTYKPTNLSLVKNELLDLLEDES